MKVSYIVTELREANTYFESRVGGIVELQILQNNAAIKSDMAFVVMDSESVEDSPYEAGVAQVITEKFSVITVISFKDSQKQELGALNYDVLHTIRSQLFRVLVGRELVGAITPITYAGAQLLAANQSYIWYQFDFKYSIQLAEYDGYSDVRGDEPVEYQERLWTFRDKTQRSQLNSLEELHADYMLSPSPDLPYTGDLPADSSLVDMSQIVDLSDDKNPGAFDRSWGSAFDFYRILNRRDDPK